METEGRSPTDPVSLYNRLSEAPWEHDFFQALRRIDAEGEKPRLGTSVRLSDDPIRLGQQPDCAFAPSTLATVAAGRDGNPPRLDVLFFGLTGPNGPLPLHLTEYARERQRNLGDPTFKRFLDIFHHRLLTLFYRAWAEARPTVSFDRPDDDVFQQWVGALSGRGFDSLRNPEGPSPTATRFYTGHLAAQTRYKEGLVGILSDYLQLPVEIEEFVGHWLDIPDATRLGQLGSTLGVDCCIGTQVWDRQHKIRIRIGPLDYLDFDHLLPHGEALAEIGAWIREYLGEELDWDLNLVLKLSDIPGTPLGGGQRLGWSTWLGERPNAIPTTCYWPASTARQNPVPKPRIRPESDKEIMMGEISRAALFGKLNTTAYKAIEAATVFCKLRGNPYVELVHWLHQLLQLQDSDLHRIIRQFNIEPSRLAKDITEALDRLPRGSTSITDLSSHVEEAVERGWVYGSLMFGETQVRTGFLVIGILKTASLRHALLSISKEFDKIKLDTLTERFAEVVSDSPEQGMSASDGFGAGAAPGEASGAIAPAAMGKQEALKRFTVDLTEQARTGKIDPIVGRDEEIRQVVDILMRRRQNNPILTGEAGVGKTAVVEGFALRIVAGDVPPALKDVELRALDVGLLQAGASMKGEFEQRLRQVIEEVQSSTKPIILFIDEAHTLVGAGGAAGTGDAANLLKPALARGNLRTVAATTWAEYKKHIEKDPALTRRFQVVQVDEPSEHKAILMMRGVASTMEAHHKVQILDEALEAAVKLSHRYIPARQLPDKSVSLLDTACARVAVSLHAVPAEVDDSRRRIEALTTELAIISRESAIGVDTLAREANARALLAEEQTRLAELEARWNSEKALVDELLAVRAKLRSAAEAVDNTGNPAEATPETPRLTEDERMALKTRVTELQQELNSLQGDHPLILPTVDYQAVASVVADWTGIPVGKMARNEIETVLNLGKHLKKRIIGQDHALEMIAKRIQTSRAGLDNPSKPIGVFMLAGTSGVGKTETALALAEAMYGGEQNIITINMSEFQEAHTVSTLKGAPPGYVGYGEGGVLTEAVRRKPYSVVLLDEVEKAHPDVHEIFFQVFDKGVMEDGEGRVIDFKNTLILLTTNAGTDLIASLCRDPELMPDPEGIAKALREPLLKVFPPALLGRLVTIPYYPLSDEMLQNITKLQLDRIKKRVEATHKVPFEYDDDVVKQVVSRCTENESGGRQIDAILTNTLLPEISREFLNRMMEGQSIERVNVRVENGEFQYRFN